MKTEKILSKPLCIGLISFAFVYGLILPFCWENDPTSELGTLSLLCESDGRQIWFWIWGIFSSGSIILNTQYMYKKFEYKNKFLNVLCLLGFIGIIFVALTLGHPINSWNPKRIIHWIATGLYIAFTIAPIALFFIINIKKFRRFVLFTVYTFLILASFLLLFGIMGKSAIMEMVPLAMFEILLFVVNFTPVGKPEIKISNT